MGCFTCTGASINQALFLSSQIVDRPTLTQLTYLGALVEAAHHKVKYGRERGVSTVRQAFSRQSMHACYSPRLMEPQSHWCWPNQANPPP